MLTGGISRLKNGAGAGNNKGGGGERGFRERGPVLLEPNPPAKRDT